MRIPVIVTAKDIPTAITHRNLPTILLVAALLVVSGIALVA
jgi:hypothetical protein